MNNSFIPNINKINFENKVIKIQNNEGCNTMVVNTIDAKINTQNVYQSFLSICEEYHIYSQAFLIESICTIRIITNGYESLVLTYEDKNKDVSIELASVLYQQLSIQIRNRDFINKARK